MKLSQLLVGLLVSGIAVAQTCSFTAFGRPCGGVLDGHQVRTGTTAIGVQIDLTRAAPGAWAVLALGQQTAPVALPGSSCPLLVMPRATVLSQTDRNGSTHWGLRIPGRAVPLSVDLQAVTIAFDRTGLVVESSNGVTLACR